MTVTVPATDLDARLLGEVVLPGDPGYDQARSVWNALIDRRPAAIARCRGTADVVAAVDFARAHGLVVAVRGGGHNVAGHAVCDDGLVIDLSEMRGVTVDPAARLAHAQGGATWADVDRQTQLFGLATPGGVVSTTGIAGLTLGGGLGWLRRRHGLSCDNLVAAEVVTADGRVLHVSDDEHPELLWGLRGGGGNFGVVTRFTYRLHQVGPTVAFAAAMYPMDRAEELLPFLADYMDDAPEDISSEALFWTVPPVDDFPADVHGQPVIVLAALHCGNPEEGMAALEPLRTQGRPLLDLSGPQAFTDVQQLFDGILPTGRYYYWKSLRLDRLDDEVIGAVIDHARSRPSPHTLMPVWHHGGAMSRVGAAETAFGDRGAPWLLSIDSTWDAPSATDENVAWTRHVWEDMRRYSSRGAYLNFPGLAEEGEDLLRASFRGTYDRLVQLKDTYDPHNVFRLNANIAPSA